MMKTLLIVFTVLLNHAAFCQQTSITIDTTKTQTLDSITIRRSILSNQVKQLPNEQGTYIFAGRKTEVINLAQLPADVTNKTGRQIFSKIPGVFVYDMDGAGNQVNIAARGLDPHRAWEFNNRKDGVITNSDMYGYPASHFSMPMESIERIELVRGTGSLQYGAQFGGMLNYVTKQGDSTRPISFENVTTLGSYNLLSTYNAVGGQLGKFRYYAYVQKKSRDGYRKNEHTNSSNEAIILTWQPNTRLSIRAEWARSYYRYQIPGALTDSMFNTDPTQATRARNYYSPDIHLPSININWQLSSATKLQLISSAVLGNRSSVLFDKPTNIRDSIVTATQQYNNRQVDIDNYHSYTTELRILQQYRLGKNTSQLVAGVQYMNNNLHRRQLGKGTTGSDYDLSLVTPGWGRDVYLKTTNLALFAENKFQLTRYLSVNAGARIELGQTDLSGTITYLADNAIPVSIRHQFPLLGANVQYQTGQQTALYAGFSQSYRAMLFKDLIPGSLFEKVDANIKDAKGYNAEIGWRGNWKFLRWDVTGYLLQYNNRFGTLALADAQGNFYTYRTNVGNSFTKGLEIFVQGDWIIAKQTSMSLFTSTALNHARYTDAMVKSGNSNVSIKGNKVESAPDLISRNGLTIRHRNLSASMLYSYTASSFADPLNTVAPLRTTGAVGLVPAYGILDFNMSCKVTKNMEVKLNVNNVANKQYFTKRPTFYPGPGIWSSDGRNASVTVDVRL